MIRRARLLSAVLTACWIVVLTPATSAAECGSDIDLNEVATGCYYSGDEVHELYNSGDGARWSIAQRCKTDSPDRVCYNPIDCVTSEGDSGTLYTILRTPPGGPREVYGVACLTSGEAGALGAITPALVFDAMKRLSWPRSVLVVQPPGGETLVNLETNFYTENTAPTTQTITLLGQRVEIEATPGSYVWHWAARGEAGNGDDSGGERTRSPGTPYPDLTVTHTYRDADITVHPWVDTVYEGRYRVNGGGWTSIPATLTVTGPAVALDVLEARPVLVGEGLVG
jgi:hypothetical protein